MEDFEWNSTNECKLFEAMSDHKPVGVNRYFEMVCILDKLQENNIDIPTKNIWDHLASMYNLQSLDEIEALPFPNDEREFYLPELEFGSMKVKKEEKIEDKIEVKKEEKVVGKKETPRRDSKDGKEAKLSVTLKKEVKKEVVEKPKPLKRIVKEEEKLKTPNRVEEAKRLNKRPTRGSMKPEESAAPATRKSQSPLPVPPVNTTKRRRL